MTTTTNTNLEALVKAYVSAKRDYDIAHSEHKNLSYHPPAIPEVFNSLEEAREYRARLDDHEAKLKALREKRTSFSEQIEALKKQILALLPIKGTWVRAGDYAVGYYFDRWGGGHYDIEIKPWVEIAQCETGSLPKLADRTYYP